MPHRPVFAALILCLWLPLAAADDKQAPQGQEPRPITQSARFDIIRAFNGELVYAHKPLPMGANGLTLKPDGTVVPDGKALDMVLANSGSAAMPGDRVRITDVIIKDKSIILEVNGGPKHKKKWYQRIEVGGMGGTTPVAPQPDEKAKGSFVALAFDKYVPQITPDELKQRLANVFDFSAKSSLEAYVETIPPKAKAAIKNHQVLVGMNREMVLYSIGKPPKKIRERDGTTEYEEWIYGEPPQEVKFIRFVGDEVTRVETMTVDGQKVVRTEKEIDIQKDGREEASAKPAEKPANAPTLRRPGEQQEADPNVVVQPGGNLPGPGAQPPGSTPGAPGPPDPSSPGPR